MAQSINFDRFERGLDLRKGSSTSDANTLRVLKNAYVTEGRSIRKRPGFTLVATLEPGTIGLFAGRGKLNTFGRPGLPTHTNPLFQSNAIIYGAARPALTSVHYAEVFNGFLYVSCETTGYAPEHHYLDGSASTIVVDANCPNSVSVIKASSKVWSIGVNGDTVRFSATNNPRNWTLANDAGFLPVGLQATGSAKATGLAYYNNRLVVFFPDSAQIWQIDVDPAKHQFLQTIDTGTSEPYAHANMAGDVFFLSPQGVRTITAQENTLSNLIDTDVGSPIDRALISGQLLDGGVIVAGQIFRRGQYYRGGGQYWLYRGKTAAVYTFSRSNKVSAWSVYEFAFDLDYIDELDGVLYARSGDNVYRFDREMRTDNGTPYAVDIEMSYLDFKAPGVLKQILSMDAVISGTATVAHRFDPRNTALITDPAVTISGDSRPGNVFPVELLATNIAPVLKNFDASDFELHSLQYIFERLGAI